MTFEEHLKQKLIAAFNPQFLEITNDSDQHRGHRESPQTEHSHFTIKMRSQDFVGISKIACHRLVYAVLEEELKSRIHALKLDLKSNEDYPILVI